LPFVPPQASVVVFPFLGDDPAGPRDGQLGYQWSNASILASFGSIAASRGPAVVNMSVMRDGSCLVKCFLGRILKLKLRTLIAAAFSSGTLFTTAAVAAPFFFSTGNPDGLIATLSRAASPGKLETETADDFVTTAPTVITSATFTGLLVGGATTANINDVEIELYHVFPFDSTSPPDGRVLTRANSPSDNNFAAADAKAGQLSFRTRVLNSSFTAANSVVNGIDPMPNQFTGGEGPVTGVEVQFNVTFDTPFSLGADHVFFRPEVDLGNAGDFLWLSAPKPIVAPGTPSTTDLQSWIRNDGPGSLAPDWERIGTDVTHQGPFNAAFSLTGTVPEPATVSLLGLGFAAMGWARRRKLN
jgi:PEP-CTERM motif-containing protein